MVKINLLGEGPAGDTSYALPRHSKVRGKRTNGWANLLGGSDNFRERGGRRPAPQAELGVTAGLSRAAVQAQVAAALHVVVHLARDPDGRRRVTEVGVLSVDHDGRVRSEPALLLSRAGAVTPGPAAGVFDALLASAG